MTSRTAYRISLVFGLLVLALTVLSVTQKAPPVCGDLPKNYPTIIAFELSRSVADLHAIFGNAPGACRTAIARQMDLVNTIDSFAFIQIYGLFLIFFYLGARERRPALAALAVMITVVACLADHVENFALFHLSADPDHATWIPLLIGATETKWIGLPLAALLSVGLLGGWLRWVALVLCGIGFAAATTTILTPAAIGPYLSNAIALGWALFLAIDVREAFRRS
jgi:hypothetical protein